MAATAAVNGPPLVYQGPNGENLQSHSGVPNPMQQDPGSYSTGQEPGSSTRPQQPLFARPVFPVHAPPPPPFLHYQWPLPFSYNPFAGFPGMGYGMVMSPFHPPYMDTPAYILPHPRVLPVDYRRLLHPQAPPAAAPQQIPHQTTQRFRVPHTPIRQTVSSGVQTDLPQRVLGSYDEGCPLVGSDSGTGTASVSPSSSHSSEVDKDTLFHGNPKESGPCTTSTDKDGLKILHYSGMTTVQSWVRATRETCKRAEDPVGQELPLVQTCRNGRRNMSSTSSPDDLVPLCSSSQREDETAQERRASVPDILMNSGGGTPLAAALLRSLNASKHLDNEQEDGIETNSHEETTEIILNIMSLNSSQRRKTLNESVWSVESLAPYFPNKDWLLQNGIFESEVFEMTQEVENGGLLTKNHNLIVQEGKERRLSRVFSPPEFIVTSESGVTFSTPANEQNPPKKQQVWPEAEVPEMRVQEEDQRTTLPEKFLTDPAPLQSKTLSTLTEEDLDGNKSSQPEANESPKQDCENEQQEEEHPSSPTKGDDVVLNSAEEKSSSSDQQILQCETKTGVACQVTSEELCVPTSDLKMEDVSPSKRHLVHSSVQCELGCLCQKLRDNMESNERQNCKPQAVKGMNLQRYSKKNQWKNRSQERFSNQQEAPGRPVKSKGGPRREHTT